jgi:hypothetical protein
LNNFHVCNSFLLVGLKWLTFCLDQVPVLGDGEEQGAGAAAAGGSGAKNEEGYRYREVPLPSVNSFLNFYNCLKERKCTGFVHEKQTIFGSKFLR